jgi:hypothetical protein
MSDQSLDRQLGDMQARLVTVERLLELNTRDTREVRDMMLQARGGWRTLAAVAGVSAAIGGLVIKLLGWLLPH